MAWLSCTSVTSRSWCGAPMAIAAGPTGLWVVFANANHTSQEVVHLIFNPRRY
jgi:hypothetical protein